MHKQSVDNDKYCSVGLWKELNEHEGHWKQIEKRLEKLKRSDEKVESNESLLVLYYIA